ncbi:uncharacterized protein ACA1_292130 [Acanthamoeba castellanii str. Neff]|uniref:Uncharacterized protein n=1 Tax=Acanthamoeba castellanii (strain ATCC 30010 / Neff) TaxID=1257118 RepID=L8HIF1_ACACF|nr:uncharacterized protein ACA1_292130 [Acanthamoeba castellanii str. Neff]ELR25374.1 hypothetical protein ACA1_292130 [Acanthamoeba castellanii str. Neff]
MTMHVDGPYVDKSAIVDHKNGTYTLLYRVSRAAQYNISVYHQGILLRIDKRMASERVVEDRRPRQTGPGTHGRGENDTRKGQGKLVWPGGGYYVGEWHDGPTRKALPHQAHGFGRREYGNGATYVGSYEKDRRVGTRSGR